MTQHNYKVLCNEKSAGERRKWDLHVHKKILPTNIAAYRTWSESNLRENRQKIAGPEVAPAKFSTLAPGGDHEGDHEGDTSNPVCALAPRIKFAQSITCLEPEEKVADPPLSWQIRMQFSYAISLIWQSALVIFLLPPLRSLSSPC